MKVQEIYKIAVGTSDMFVKMYLSDFSDADLMVRPDPAANHAAWQMAHLIKSEHNMIEAIKPGHAAKLPDGFLERHTKEMKDSNNSSDFLTKAEYIEIYERQRSSTLEVITTITDEELSKPGPEGMRTLAPTVASVLYIAATHPMLHCGQFVVIRRKLGKPVLL